MFSQSRYGYLRDEMLPDELLGVLGEVPKRWGRMDMISRLAIVEVGRVLAAGAISRSGDGGRGRGGLIGFTRRGSLATDLDYVASVRAGLEMASPTLFSYTLANIALAEAASHYDLTGPVYAVFAEAADAEATARRWLENDNTLRFMVVGELDLLPGSLRKCAGAAATAPAPASEKITANFKIVS